MKDILKTLEGGCTAPIGASEIINNRINFKGVLLALDGSHKIEVNDSINQNYILKMCSSHTTKWWQRING